jgi:miniconductance mechanosensitive channel
MIPRILLPLVFLSITVGAMPQAPSQDAVDDNRTDPKPQQPEIESLTDLHDKFETMKDPLLTMGDTGDRVRELQATLNMKLGGQPPIMLMHPLLVSRSKGPPGSEGKPTKQHRLAYSEHRDVAFQIRGDWTPVDKDGVPLKYAEGVDHLEVRFLKLPQGDNPLKLDGIFGQHTKVAVALFQHQQGLPVSGDVDAVTLDKLEPLVPTNPILSFTMSRVKPVFDPNQDYNPRLVKTFTSLLVTLSILLAAAVVYQIARSLANSTHFLSRWLFTPESSPWFTAMLENKFFRCGAQFAPALFIYLAGRLIFPAPEETDNVFPYLNTFQNWHLIVSHLGLAYMSLVLMLVGFAAANATNSVVNPDQKTENPIGSIIRAAKRVIGFLGTLLIVASLAGKSPFLIVGGLGAFMAVFMLVFKDYLLGLVSSVQIIANKVVRIGDWISMPKFNADGDVLKISLTLIKVQNFDKTISTIPTSAVLTESFQNWTGVERSGGRRIKRSILIDMRRIQICTAEMIERFQRIELIDDYLKQKESELEEYNRNHQVEASAVNSRRLTNIGTFRAYLDQYLRHHPALKDDMTILVRHLQPTSKGLPVEIYAFCDTTEWAVYEAAQADIFDHVLAILPEFGLRAFQELTESDADRPTAVPFLPKVQAGLAELESLVEAENHALADNSRTRPASRLQRIRKHISDLDLDKHFQAEAEGRKIILHHLEDH